MYPKRRQVRLWFYCFYLYFCQICGNATVITWQRSTALRSAAVGINKHAYTKELVQESLTGWFLWQNLLCLGVSFYKGLALAKLTGCEDDFALSFSVLFFSCFVHAYISGSVDPITLIWVSLGRSFPPAELECKWCQIWSKVLMSEVEQRPTLVMASYSQHRRQWVNHLEESFC